LNSIGPFALDLGWSVAFWQRNDGRFDRLFAVGTAWLATGGISSTIALHMEN
jgi:hypothetical protein